MINFFQEDIDFDLKEKEKIQNWLGQIITFHQFELSGLNYIFCTDTYLHKINLQYLNHDTFTDIITFDNSDVENVIEGDIYISIERIRENAKKFNTDFANELYRVIAHGLLHLLGFVDKSQDEKIEMRQKEDEALILLQSL